MAKAQTKFNERRVFVRRLVTARVKLVHGTIGEVRGKTRDISDSGVFVVVKPVPKLPVGSHVKMHMLDSTRDRFQHESDTDNHGRGWLDVYRLRV